MKTAWTNEVDLWLDDWRPAPDGWLHVKTIADAKLQLETGRVRKASLDHDLGACRACMGGLTEAEWMDRAQYQTMPHCEHVGTGYQLCVWMAETGHWPRAKPNVHSANAVGRERMLGVIERYWHERDAARDR